MSAIYSESFHRLNTLGCAVTEDDHGVELRHACCGATARFSASADYDEIVREITEHKCQPRNAYIERAGRNTSL